MSVHNSDVDFIKKNKTCSEQNGIRATNTTPELSHRSTRHFLITTKQARTVNKSWHRKKRPVVREWSIEGMLQGGWVGWLGRGKRSWPGRRAVESRLSKWYVGVVSDKWDDSSTPAPCLRWRSTSASSPWRGECMCRVCRVRVQGGVRVECSAVRRSWIPWIPRDYGGKLHRMCSFLCKKFTASCASAQMYCVRVLCIKWSIKNPDRFRPMRKLG